MEGSQQVSETNSSSETIHSKVTHVFGHAQKQWYTSAVQNSEHPNLNQEVRSGNGTSTQPMQHCQQESERSISAIPKSTKEPSKYTCISDTTLTSKPAKGCEEKKKSRGREKSNSIAQESQKDRGITRFLDGISYQKNLLILTLCHAFKLVQNDDSFKFNITSEDPEGGKFDDIVVRFKNYYEDSSVFIQAKHKENLESKITLADLKSTDKTAPFSISKYFNDFLHQNWDKTNEARVLILCTNAGIAQDAKDFMKEYSFNGSIVDSFLKSLSDNVYTIDELRVDKKSKTTLIDHLKENTDLYSLAKQIAEHIFKEKIIDLRQALFNKYNNVIHQIALKCSTHSKCCNVNEAFFNSLQAKEFKNIFENEYRKLLKDQHQDIWEDIRRKGIKLSQAKTTENQQNVQLEQNNPFDCCGLPPKVEESQIQKFLKSFIIVCKTKHEKNEVITNMLKNSDYKLIPQEIQGPAYEFAYERLSNWVMEWIQSKNGANLVKNDVHSFLNYFVSSVHYFRINDVSKIPNMGFQCKDDVLLNRNLYKKLNLWLSEPDSDETGISKMNIKRCNYPPWLVIQVVQRLRDNCAEDNKPDLVFLEAISYDEKKATVENVFCTMDFPIILVIDYNEANANVDVFSKWNLRNKIYKKMIIIIGQVCSLKEAETPLSIQHLTHESRNKLTTKNATFFGAAILHQDIFRASDSLNFITDVENFRIDSAVKRNIIDEKYGEIQRLYIPRKWKRLRTKHNSLENNSTKNFWSRVYNVDDIRQKFGRAERITMNHFLQHFHIDDKIRNGMSRRYIWKNVVEKENISHQPPPGVALNNSNSFADNTGLNVSRLATLEEKKSFHNSSSNDSSDDYEGSYDEENNATHFNKKVHIILNEAGAGKSFYLTWLAKQLQNMNECKDWWIVKLNLIEHCKEFEDMQNNSKKLNEQDAIRQLFKLTYSVFHMHDSSHTMDEKRRTAKEISEKLRFFEGKIESDESQLICEDLVLHKLFENKFNNNKLAVLMDGFDEIAPHYKDDVLKLLSILKSLEGICKIYLTSRPYDFQSEIDATLGDCEYYILKNFEIKDVITYTRRFLSIHCKAFQSGNDEIQIQMMQVHFVLLYLFLSNIIHTPLFLTMGLELLLPIVEQNCDSETISLEILDDCEKHFGPLEMMKAFIKKRLIINVEKAGACVSTPAMISAIDNNYENILITHSLLALYAVLNKYEVKELLSPQAMEKATSYMEDLKSGKEKSGLVNAIMDNVPIFIHRLFGEYFAAVWFHSNVRQARVVNFLKSHVYGVDKKEEIRQFLDRMVCEKNVLHTAILDGLHEKVKTLLFDKPILINETDSWGRTPLQLVLICDSLSEVGFLLDRIHEKTINFKDQVFEWTAIDYILLRLTAFYDEDCEAVWYRALMFEDNLLTGVVRNADLIRRVKFMRHLFAKMILNFALENQSHLNCIGRLFSRCSCLHSRSKYQKIVVSKLYAILDEPKPPIFLRLLKKNENRLCNVSSLIEFAIERFSVHFLHFLIVTLKLSFADELVTLMMYMQYDERKFRDIFHKYCKRFNIKCVKEKDLQLVFDVPVRRRRFSRIKDIWNDRPVNFELSCTFGINVGTEFLIHVALQTNTLSILEYLIQKTKIAINNRLIIHILQKYETNWCCHSSFHFLLSRNENLWSVDENGRNLLHFAVVAAQPSLVKCLIELNYFKPTDRNPEEKNWDAFFYCVLSKYESKMDLIDALRRRFDIFDYMMDLRKETPLDCFNHLDLDGKSVFYYAMLHFPLISQNIFQKKFAIPLEDLNAEQITCLTKLLNTSGFNSEEILHYLRTNHLSNETSC